MLGSLIVRDLITQTEFEIGTGFTAVERQVLWAQQKRLVGQVVKYKHQKSGEKDKPRFPVFLGFRNGVDIS
jgi:DNA ligase-1